MNFIFIYTTLSDYQIEFRLQIFFNSSIIRFYTKQKFLPPCQYKRVGIV
ncbi:hypothetical protein pb186bvf_004191 [Paramecium bursaria]